VAWGIQCWQTLKQLLVAGVNEGLNDAPDMRTFESGIAPHPVGSPRQNHVPSMSIDDGLKLVDVWRTGRQIQASNDTLDSSTSSWPRSRVWIVPTKDFIRGKHWDEADDGSQSGAQYILWDINADSKKITEKAAHNAPSAAPATNSDIHFLVSRG
jgi:hypothetical protein